MVPQVARLFETWALPPVRPTGTARRVRRRPVPCRLAVEALEDRSVPASLSVSDVMLLEGNDGTQNAAVTVSLSAPSNRTVTVNYGTANGTATAGSDYNAVSGKLTFARGETSKTILIPVRGDRLAEPDETFFVNLSGAKKRRIADARGSSPSWTTTRLPHQHQRRRSLGRERGHGTS